MVVANNIHDREFERFDQDGNVKVSIQSSLVPESYDSISLTQNATQDIWTYTSNTVTVAIVTVTYTSSSKKIISTVVRT
jgi:predicted acyl esterase